MGIFIYLFDYDRWYSLFYKNCTLFTPQQWHELGPPNIPIGILYITLGICAQIIYIPFLFALSKKEFFQHSCYKIMFLLAIIDLISLPVDSIVSGIQVVLGLHFCTNPVFFYCMASITLSCWYGVTMTCVILAWDRFFEILLPNQAKIIFGKYMIFVWLAIPPLYILGSNFFIPAEFGSIKRVLHTDPFFGVEGMQLNPKFLGWNLVFLYANSLVAVIGLGLPYGILCVYFVIMKWTNRHSTSLNKFQRVMLLQSFAICSEMFIVAIVYVANGIIWEPDFILIIEHATKIFVHGDTPLVYLFLNDSLRRQFLEQFRGLRSKMSHYTRKYAFTVTISRVNPDDISTRLTSLKEETKTVTVTPSAVNIENA